MQQAQQRRFPRPGRPEQPTEPALGNDAGQVTQDFRPGASVLGIMQPYTFETDHSPIRTFANSQSRIIQAGFGQSEIMMGRDHHDPGGQSEVALARRHGQDRATARDQNAY